MNKREKLEQMARLGPPEEAAIARAKLARLPIEVVASDPVDSDPRYAGLTKAQKDKIRYYRSL